MRRADDTQSCIRTALRRRRRTLGLTQEDAANILGMSRMLVAVWR
jgi:predicted transcriptional regulator